MTEIALFVTIQEKIMNFGTNVPHAKNGLMLNVVDWNMAKQKLNTGFVIVVFNMQPDYCWRDYEGITPHDAFKGGLDKHGKSIYIGQVLYEKKIIPGKIIEGNSKIYFEWNNKEYSRTLNIKIFCTDHPEKFQWIPTKHNQVSLLTNKILVKGGYEENFSTYIGRAFTDGQTLVGKVMCQTDNCLGLYTTNDKHFKEHKVFEILSYNPEPLNVVDLRYNT